MSSIAMANGKGGTSQIVSSHQGTGLREFDLFGPTVTLYNSNGGKSIIKSSYYGADSKEFDIFDEKLMMDKDHLFTGNGYQIFSNGFTIQWGEFSQLTSSETLKVVFNIAFEHGPLSGQVSYGLSNIGGSGVLGIYDMNKTGAIVSSSYNAKALIRWLVVGF